MKQNYFKFIYWLFLFVILSCSVEGGPISSLVTVLMWEKIPIVRYSAQERVVCRKGLPPDYITPWEKEAKKEDQEGFEEESAEGLRREITTSVDNIWFQVSPLINNKSRYHLIINEIVFKVVPRASVTQSTTLKEFTSGSYCETNPLYWLEPREVLIRPNIDKRFEKGNLVFFIDGLPAEEFNQQNEQNSGHIQYNKIPQYRVFWYMSGNFREPGGAIVSEFQKRGSFITRKITF